MSQLQAGTHRCQHTTQHGAPFEKLLAVVEAEHVVVIFDVVLVQQLVQLIQLQANHSKEEKV